LSLHFAAFMLIGRAEGACIFCFRFLGLLTAKLKNNPYRLASFLFSFLIFLSFGFMRDTYGATIRHLFFAA